MAESQDIVITPKQADVQTSVVDQHVGLATASPAKQPSGYQPMLSDLVVADRHMSVGVEDARADVSGRGDVTVGEMYIYPVKSAGFLPVRKWLLTPAGLLLDRAFMVVDM